MLCSCIFYCDLCVCVCLGILIMHDKCNIINSRKLKKNEAFEIDNIAIVMEKENERNRCFSGVSVANV